CFGQRTTGGELRRDGGREGATGSVQRFFADALSGQRGDFVAVKQNVDGAVHVTALNDDGASAHFHNLTGRGFHIAEVLDGHAREDFRFGNIGRDHAGAL